MADSPIAFLEAVFRECPDADAIVWRDEAYSYAWLLERLGSWRARLEEEDVTVGAVVLIRADFSPNAVALFLALLERGCVLVPLTESVRHQWDAFSAIAQGEVAISIGAGDEVEVTPLERIAEHAHVETLRRRGHPGLVLFSSGSTGDSKAAVHDMLGILD